MPIRKKIFQFIRAVSARTSSTSKVTNITTAEMTRTVYPEPPQSFIPAENQTASNDLTSEMDMGLVLYGRPTCPYCARVDRVIEELDIESKITRRLTTYGSEWRTDLRNRTGRTQVPCLFIDGEVMFESADIIDWMRNNFG